MITYLPQWSQALIVKVVVNPITQISYDYDHIGISNFNMLIIQCMWGVWSLNKKVCLIYKCMCIFKHLNLNVCNFTIEWSYAVMI